MENLPQSPQPIEQPLKPTEVAPAKPAFPLWGGALIAVLIGGGALLTWRALNPSKPGQTIVAPTPMSTPTPTPSRQLSAIATSSAFLSLEAGVTSLSGHIQNFVTEDPSLSPPVLDLPLGF
ncbi:hypothetical protein A2875_04160 [Candidatus Gottesmanbacteria bacterium RIFCSPHIGHO2_01_FULL_46_14]|uniref:Uncharacterized protein n=3 Tax=Microgenomates group TaxID=1794810 RepID=A0A1F5ZSV0_9BACT|nr:MAG: hypothetical protein UU34_C0014G0013 [Candidatus Curtissbacteria bacterium GW2011_GWA1_41_11]OGG15453.1 MAG: hypothetical protein A2875_04160 [Candidatus Gottesmanbacteria bacterium RIFCSPHIGHO2_01_FULL_46_14]OGG30205.1 MAG: hypothetical protein A2971_04100 [Candidatus Gottesmanbacteria bacterium RIFCSPLOWO2_01_FULL_46_21]